MDENSFQDRKLFKVDLDTIEEQVELRKGQIERID